MAERSIRVNIVGDASSLERSFGRASRSASTFNRDLGRSTRGALAGSGVFRGLGRSIAFASGGFLAFASAGQFIRTSIDAAKENVVVQRQLAAQFRASGKDLGVYQGQIDKTVNRLSLLAGFQNDELKGAFTTIFRVTGNVSKALRDTATAADFARAKHISLSTAAVLLAKVEGGNTTLLRRQGVQVAKNATVEQALAQVRLKFAGQARAGTTEQERFGAVLHNTEEIIGTGILPTLNKYLASGSKWLEQMNESGKLQKDVATGAQKFGEAMHDASVVVRDAVVVVKRIDDVTGSLENTLKVLAVFKLSSMATNVVAPILGIGKAARTSREEVALLRGSLLRLGAVGVVTVGVEVLLHRPQIDKAVTGFLDKHGLGFFSGSNNLKGLNSDNINDAIAAATKAHDSFTVSVLNKVADLFDKQFKGGVGSSAAAEAAAKAAHGIALAAATAATSGNVDDTAKHVVNLTAAQRNTFFDNSISRLLLRGGLGDIQKQISALNEADRKIAERIAKTKDVTRKLNLEDELLQNQAQIRSLKAQQAADAVQAAADAHQKALDALTARSARNQALQFKALGLSGTGDQIIPVRVLENELRRLTKSVDGTLLDTKKTTTLFAHIRKIFAGGFGAITADTKQQVKTLLDGIDDQLKKHAAASGFRRANSLSLIKSLGLNLTADEIKRLSGAFSALGPGGTLPGTRSPAFSQAGATTIVMNNPQFHGVKDAAAMEAALAKRAKRRTASRRGPYAGRH